MNILIKYKKIHKYESVWRNNIKISSDELLFLTKEMKIDLFKDPVVYRYIDLL